MRRTLFVLPLLFTFIFTFSHGQKLDKYESTITEFEQEDIKNGFQPGSILFTGSSSIRRWKPLSEDMSPMLVINRGFGGSTIPEVTYYADRIILPHHPKIIVIYCGENDLANDQAKSKLALKSFKKFVSYLEMNLPNTKVFFITIKPSIKRWNYWPKLEDANTKIEKYITKKDNLYYVDAATKMLDESGIVLQDIFVEDNLHMNATGYKIWAETLKPVLEEHYSD